MPKWLVLICIAASVAGSAHAQSQTTLLHDALHLTPAQEDAWRAYQRGIAMDAQESARTRQTAALLPTLPTPRRLALIRAQMQADLTSFDHKAQVVNAFYAALMPDQQHTFDRQTAASGGGPQGGSQGAPPQGPPQRSAPQQGDPQ